MNSYRVIAEWRRNNHCLHVNDLKCVRFAFAGHFVTGCESSWTLKMNFVLNESSRFDLWATSVLQAIRICTEICAETDRSAMIQMATNAIPRWIAADNKFPLPYAFIGTEREREREGVGGKEKERGRVCCEGETELLSAIAAANRGNTTRNSKPKIYTSRRRRRKKKLWMSSRGESACVRVLVHWKHQHKSHEWYMPKGRIAFHSVSCWLVCSHTNMCNTPHVFAACTP